MLEGSQGQFIALEKKMQGEVTAVEKKYHKAKKIIKEYQQRLVSTFFLLRESLTLLHVNNKSADQPADGHRLINSFVFGLWKVE